MHQMGTMADEQQLATEGDAVTKSMTDDYFYNADGEMLIVPQAGALRFFTEFGIVDTAPGEIAVMPRGVKYRVELNGETRAAGYICENYGQHLTCPERGPIGANCLANRRDFLTPVAAFEQKDGTACRLTAKWGGAFQFCKIDHSLLFSAFVPVATKTATKPHASFISTHLYISSRSSLASFAYSSATCSFLKPVVISRKLRIPNW